MHSQRIKASPRARRALRRSGISASQIVGSGPGGRIVEADVLAAADRSGGFAQPAPRGTSSMRQAVAASTASSFAATPHFYLRAEIDATALVQLRSQLAEPVERDADARLTFTDLLLAAVGHALADLPEANRVWRDDSVFAIETANVGLVVGLDDGLLVPVIGAVDRLALAEITRRRAECVTSARQGRLPAGASIACATSISNLGNSRVDEFAAIIPPGQSSVLAVGRMAARPMVVDGQLVARETLRLCLSVDHRVLDGQPAARFLGRIVEYLEQPARMIYAQPAPL